MRRHTALFITAWLQVGLIATNTWQIANQRWLGALIVGFLISWVWCGNIKKVVASTTFERIIYCTGAMTGTGTGILITQILYQ